MSRCLSVGSVRVLALLISAGLVGFGCVEERVIPSGAQMCEDLAQTCGVPELEGYVGLEACAAAGREGIRDAKQQDQCFAVYDECISDCLFYAFYEPWNPAGPVSDASRLDSGVAVDGAIPAPVDAAVADSGLDAASP